MATFNIKSTGREVVQAFGTHVAGKIGMVLLRAINDYLLTIPVLITGPSKDGIGAEIAETLASGDPDHLLLAGRNEAKIIPVIREIQKTKSNIKVTYVQCDQCARLQLESTVSCTKSISLSIILGSWQLVHFKNLRME